MCLAKLPILNCLIKFHIHVLLFSFDSIFLEKKNLNIMLQPDLMHMYFIKKINNRTIGCTNYPLVWRSIFMVHVFTVFT